MRDLLCEGSQVRLSGVASNSVFKIFPLRIALRSFKYLWNEALMDYKREGHVWGIRSVRSFSLVNKKWNGGGSGGGGGGGGWGGGGLGCWWIKAFQSYKEVSEYLGRILFFS